MSMITVSHLVKTYAGRNVVDDVSFTVQAGEIFGLLGPNGAGKSTTAECIAGLRAPDQGSVQVLGVDPHADRATVRRQVGVQLQQSELPEKLRVREALTLFASFYPDPADPDDLLEVMGLAPAANRSWHVLSGGQRQRLSIALALIGNPRIAVLDELTTGLDPAARHQTWDLIESVRDRGTTILLVTHFMPEAERLCDRLAFIDNGRISALDTPAGIVARLSTEPDEGGRLNGRYGMAFRPSVDVDDRLLTNLPEVTTLRRDGGRITVTGTGDLVSAVTTALARNGVIAHQLRVEQPSLDDAFVTLTERNDR